ncbi:MAG: FkbM family methyltransferase [Rhodospirillales bacterium]|nr:FkbM family methyltransferase [Rhodospirillales bacterium]MBT5352601.1 FkbM family methyltransferase [Rhodospirillales bacterium]
MEEKLKSLLVPPGLYIRYRTAKELRRGEKELHLLPYIVPQDRIALDIGANKGGSLRTAKVPDNFMAVLIEMRRLDDMGLSDIGFIKLDVEGFEMAVLNSANETIARDRPTMLIEIEKRHTGRPLAEMIDETEARGYQTYALCEGGLQSFSRVYD